VKPQIRPRIDEDIAARVQAWADEHGVQFTAAVNMLVATALASQPAQNPQEIQR
jgi:antitoxin component of RelBE/YafQ-DinJ toxin-antitoxin module